MIEFFYGAGFNNHIITGFGLWRSLTGCDIIRLCFMRVFSGVGTGKEITLVVICECGQEDKELERDGG